MSLLRPVRRLPVSARHLRGGMPAQGSPGARGLRARGQAAEAPIRPLIPRRGPTVTATASPFTPPAGGSAFTRSNGRDLVDIGKCLLARDDVNAQLTRLRAARPADGHHSLRDATVPPSGFFQANHDLLGALKKLIAGALPERGEVLLEGYCGGGFFTGELAARFDRVIAIDNDPRTLRDAQRLAQRQRRVGAKPTRLRAAGGTRRPRRGRARRCERAARPAARGSAPARHRGAVRLPGRASRLRLVRPRHAGPRRAHASKTYRLVAVQPIDLFPRTAQIECVSVWKR